MADQFDKAKRSEIMSRVKSKNTGAERIVFAYLRKEKVYFQKHYKRVVGTPDIALPRKKKAVFIDSAFWHGHTYGKIFKDRPADDYWKVKIKRNMERDKAQRDALLEDGWSVLVVLENDVKRKNTCQQTLGKIKNFLTSESTIVTSKKDSHMSDQSSIIWTPSQRQAVIHFLKQYTSELESAKDDPERDYGLRGIQAGILHLADKVLPSKTTYVVNQGPKSSIRDGVQIILTDEEFRKLEKARSGEAEA